MTLPNFIIIGAQRCGTTWLDTQLRTHSDIFLPRKRKEPHFFDDNYEKGLEWYKRFFKNSELYTAVGEITPDYLPKKYVHERLFYHLPDITLLAILRNPVNRLYSAYGRDKLHYNIKKSFREFVNTNEMAVQRGYYADQLHHLYKYYSPQQVHIFIFEEVMKDPIVHLKRIAHYLHVDENLFKINTLRHDSIGGSYLPRFKSLRQHIFKLYEFLRNNDLDWIANLCKCTKLHTIFYSKQKLPPMNEEDQKYVSHLYKQSIRDLEKLLNRKLDIWKH